MRAALAVAVAASMLLVGPAPSGLAASSASIQKELDAVAAAYAKLETQLAQTEARQKKLEHDRRNTDQVVAARAAALQRRAGYMYKRGGLSALLSDLFMAPNLGVFIKRVYYLERLGSSDAELVEGLKVAQNRADEIAANLSATKARQTALARDLKAKSRQLEEKLAEAKKQEDFKQRQAAAKLKAAKIANDAQRRQLEAASKGVKITNRVREGKFRSFALPIAGGAGFANTWGAPRSGGRRHQGTDLMAPCGAPVVAVTDGVISRLQSGGNGGVMAYLRATNGDVFFYAHLQSYAPGISQGKRVSAGDLIAYNGRSGNARGGPCHVHFEWHPGGGRPANPYPLLSSARTA
ncbi:MAG: peptidoglycan DD-metalloendopeptidase family protein [Actinomycetota bacterium]|nr:peptidoglycan DD-metalloendopeptidase family protein [Actinomycetota bacterium]